MGQNRWYDKMSLIIFIVPIVLTLISVIGVFYVSFYRLDADECRIATIEKYGSPSVQALKKDVRWIMQNMAQKWGLIVPEDEAK